MTFHYCNKCTTILLCLSWNALGFKNVKSRIISVTNKQTQVGNTMSSLWQILNALCLVNNKVGHMTTEAANQPSTTNMFGHNTELGRDFWNWKAATCCNLLVLPASLQLQCICRTKTCSLLPFVSGYMLTHTVFLNSQHQNFEFLNVSNVKK